MKIVAILILYATVLFIAWWHKRKLDTAERKTFIVIYLMYAISIFFINYLGYVIGVFSYLPWFPNNFLHTFVWIGIVLTYLFMAIRKEHMVVQFMAFAAFSLVIRYAEYKIFGVWDGQGTLYESYGTDAYIALWSYVDGFYSIATFLLLRILKKWIPGLIDIPPGN